MIERSLQRTAATEVRSRKSSTFPAAALFTNRVWRVSRFFEMSELRQSHPPLSKKIYLFGSRFKDSRVVPN